jgi:metallo-beta-lactamase family protein
VGFQAEDTKGRLLQQGMKTIRIHKEHIPVKAQIKTVESLSAHADSDELIDWVSRIEKKPKQVFINHGSLSSARALSYRLRHELDLKTVIPKSTQEFVLFD